VKPFVLYTLARAGLLLVAAILVWLVLGLPELNSGNTLWILLIALVASSLASIKLLAGLRANLSASVASRADQLAARVEQSRRREDDLD